MTSKSTLRQPLTLKLKTATNPQLKFWQDESRFRLFVGGRGSGKTLAGVIECFRQAKGTIGMVTSPTYNMLNDGPIRTFLQIAQHSNVLEYYNSTRHVARLAGGREILFRSADNPVTMRGATFDWVYFDEASFISEEIWQTVLPTLRGHPGRGWLTTTPNGIRHWLYKTFVQSQNPDYSVITSATTENIFLPDFYVPTLKASLPSALYRQEVEGLFIHPIGQLFQEEWFDIVTAAPANLQWYRYWDLATSTKSFADFTASVRVALHDGYIYVDGGIHMKAEWPDVRRVMIQTMRKESHDTTQIVEEALHGLAVIQELQRLPELVNVGIMGYKVREDKIQRALPWAAKAEHRLVKIVYGAWVQTFLDEVTDFPSGQHDDYVDACSGAIAMLGDGMTLYDFL